MRRFRMFLDNAMLYKDITQWLRNRFFVSLFFGLLVLSELISLIVATSPLPVEDSGPMAFGILWGLLIIYMLIIAVMGYRLTTLEFVNRTFELYEISGMSLERMVFGKLLSMLSQFLFGFFCIVPFMFFSYVLGGLDFYVILSAVLATALVVLPFYLFILLIALFTRLKGVGRFFKVVGLILLLILVPYILILIPIFLTDEPGIMRALTEFLKRVAGLEWEAIGALLLSLLFYGLVCLLLFFLGCNSVSPAVDSRERTVKILCTVLSFSLLGFTSHYYIRSGGVSHALLHTAVFSTFFVMCLLGLISFFNRMDPPVMEQVRGRRAGRLARPLHFLFQAGAVGAFRTIMLLWAGIVLYWIAMLFVMGAAFTLPTSRAEIFSHIANSVSIPLQVPFFVAAPGYLLFYSEKIRRKPSRARVWILAIWVIFGILMIIGVALSNLSQPGWSDSAEAVTEALAIFASPLSSLMVGVMGENAVMEAGAALRIVTGLAGITGMWGILRRRRDLEDEYSAEASRG